MRRLHKVRASAALWLCVYRYRTCLFSIYVASFRTATLAPKPCLVSVKATRFMSIDPRIERSQRNANQAQKPGGYPGRQTRIQGRLEQKVQAAVIAQEYHPQMRGCLRQTGPSMADGRCWLWLPSGLGISNNAGCVRQLNIPDAVWRWEALAAGRNFHWLPT